MSLHGHTAYPLALTTLQSDVGDFYQSAPFGNFRKQQEASAKTTTALFARLDGICKQIGGLAKVFSGRR